MKQFLLFSFVIFILSGFDGKAQTALEFDGTDDYVQTEYAGVSGTTPRTFQAWIYLSTAPTSNKTITDYGMNAVGSRNTFIVNGNGYLAYLSGGTNANMSASVATVPIGSWIHVAFVYDGTNGFLYQNGEQVGTGLLTTVNTPTGGTNFRIGQRVSGGNIPFEGKIDEVRVWDVALTPQEVIDYACIGDPSQFENLITYYDFNDGSGTILTDLVGGYDGTLMNMDEEDWVVSEVCNSGHDISFTVLEEDGVTPIVDATIDLDGDVKYSDENGEAVYYYYEPGTYTYSVTKSDYIEQVGTVEVIDEAVTVEIIMLLIEYYDVTFVVVESPGGSPVEDALVNMDGILQYTNESGETTFSDYLPGSYDYNVSKEGYELVINAVEVIDDNVTVNIDLPLTLVYYDITFSVTETPGGAAVEDAVVDLDGVMQNTNVNGVTTFTDYLPGSYPYEISKESFLLESGTAELIDQDLTIDIEMVISSIEKNSLDGINVFPNPTYGLTNINFDRKFSSSPKIEITNAAGKLLKTINTEELNNQIDLSQYGKGVYWLRIYLENDSFVTTIIVK